MVGGHSHRSTIKKNKKAFKSRHASKGQIKARNQGKIEKNETFNKKSLKSLNQNKLQRKNQNDQLKEKKLIQMVQNKKLYQSINGIHKTVTIVSLTNDINSFEILSKIIKDEEILIDANEKIHNIRLTKFKSNLKIMIPDHSNKFEILEFAKISDFVIFCLSGQEEINKDGEDLVRAIELQGIDQVMGVINNIDLELKDKQQKSVINSLESYFQHFFPNNDKLYNFHQDSQIQKFLHNLSSIVPKGINWLNKRGYLIAENLELINDKLIMEGTVRGDGFFVGQIVDLPGVGEFKIDGIEKLINKHTGEAENIDNEPEFLNNNNDEEVIDDEMMVDEDEDESYEIDNEEEFKDTFLSPEDKDFDPEIEEVLSGKLQLPAGKDEDTIHLELNEDINQDQLNSFIEESQHPGSIDEYHLDPKVSAIEDLKDYQFSLNEVGETIDPSELVPENTYKPSSFRAMTQRSFKIFKNHLVQVNLGDKVKLHLSSFKKINPNDEEIFKKLSNFKSYPTTVFGLLPNEEKSSLCNFTIKSWEDYEEPIVSNEEILVQYGSRRQLIKPLYSVNSNNTNGNLHKYLEFCVPNQFNMASANVPCYFGRIPCLFFKVSNMQFIGSGTFENIDPTRITVKRRILVGQPFKIHKKVVTIRYMFFNPRDIEYFKRVPLFTKSGCSGFIRESLGTHGYFKASFNRKLSAQDYVYMALYKPLKPSETSSPYLN